MEKNDLKTLAQTFENATKAIVTALGFQTQNQKRIQEGNYAEYDVVDFLNLLEQYFPTEGGE